MKIKNEHIEIIKPLIVELLSAKNAEIIEHIKYLRVLLIQEKVKDINMRLCFDILYLVDKNTTRSFYDQVYQYANDDHVYSVLKSIIKPSRLTEVK